MTDRNSHFDLVIIGAGVTGLSCAYHAEKLGLKNLVLLSAPTLPSAIDGSHGLLFPAPLDNFTRFSHAHGIDFATRFWKTSYEALKYTVSFLNDFGVPSSQMDLHRLVLTAEEKVEALKAIEQLKAVNGSAAWSDAVGKLGYHIGVGVQYDSQPLRYVSPDAFYHALRQRIKSPSMPHAVASIATKNAGYTIILEDGSELSANFVVLAAHLQIPEIFPQVRDWFVATSEQWHVFQTEEQPQLNPHASIANYGHEVFAYVGERNFLASGARFLRKHAGIDEEKVVKSDKIQAYFGKRLREVYGLKKEPACVTTWVGKECRPCDELPIIGPMFGETGLLMASGYMGQGLTLGFYAGSLLAELVQSGKSKALMQELSPARFRSLKAED